MTRTTGPAQARPASEEEEITVPVTAPDRCLHELRLELAARQILAGDPAEEPPLRFLSLYRAWRELGLRAGGELAWTYRPPAGGDLDPGGVARIVLALPAAAMTVPAPEPEPVLPLPGAAGRLLAGLWMTAEAGAALYGGRPAVMGLLASNPAGPAGPWARGALRPARDPVGVPVRPPRRSGSGASPRRRRRGPRRRAEGRRGGGCVSVPGPAAARWCLHGRPAAAIALGHGGYAVAFTVSRLPQACSRCPRPPRSFRLRRGSLTGGGACGRRGCPAAAPCRQLAGGGQDGPGCLALAGLVRAFPPGSRP